MQRERRAGIPPPQDATTRTTVLSQTSPSWEQAKGGAPEVKRNKADPEEPTFHSSTDEPGDYKPHHKGGWTGFKIDIEDSVTHEQKEIFLCSGDPMLIGELKRRYDIPGGNVVNLEKNGTKKFPEATTVNPATPEHLALLRAKMAPLGGGAAAVTAGNVLIHCKSGINRTSAGAFVYLVDNLNMEPSQARTIINNALARRDRFPSGHARLDIYGAYEEHVISPVTAAHTQRNPTAPMTPPVSATAAEISVETDNVALARKKTANRFATSAASSSSSHQATPSPSRVPISTEQPLPQPAEIKPAAAAQSASAATQQRRQHNH